MVKKFISIVNREWTSINAAALLLGIFSILSQFLGLFRDRALAHFIGPSVTLDVYYAAFRIPDFLYVGVASLVSVTILLPLLSERMKGSSRPNEETIKFFNDVFTTFLGLIIVIALVAFIAMPWIAHFVVPGFGVSATHLFVTTSRIMLLSPILLGVSNMLGTVTQLFRKFFVFSIAPLFYNLGIIIGIFFFYPSLGLTGLALGVAFGALLHLCIQLPAVFSSGFQLSLRPHANFRHSLSVFRISLPRTIGLSLSSISIIVLTAIASTLAPGSISIFNFSLNLQSVPLGVIGISYAVAVFPLMVSALESGNRTLFMQSLTATIRQIIFWSLPVTFLFIVLRAQIVRVILGSGAFSWNDTRLTAAALAIFVLSLLAQNLVTVLIRAYYAAGNTKKPLTINFFSALITIGSAYVFISLFSHVPTFHYFIESILRVEGIPGTIILMLPLAFLLGSVFNFIFLWISLKHTLLKGSDFKMRRTFFHSFSAAFFMGVAAYFMLQILAPVFNLNTFLGILAQGFISGIFGIAVGVCMLVLLKNEEFAELIAVFRRKFWKAKVVPHDTSDIHA